MEFKELGFGNKDGLCPHCAAYYDEEQLDDLLSLDEETYFRCSNCEKWMRGFADFSFGDDVEYYLFAIEPVDESNK